MQKGQNFRGGFALPTVLIASVVMLIVLAVSVSSVAAVRTTLKTQYYEQLAKAAGEAGVAYAKACLAKNANKPLWTDTKPLKPSTDCAGNALLNPEVQVLAVAGGGGGGYNHGGGGGGGGVSYQSSFNIAAGQSYPTVVGAGGAAGNSTSNSGSKGGDSSFGGTVTAVGGGGGGSRLATNSVSASGVGGSGGGGAGTIDGGTGVPGAGAAGTSGQGYSGGNGSSGATAGNGGGGGGAGGAGGSSSGVNAGEGTSGKGGSGYLSDISGAVFYYGGGGSGGRWASGSVGLPGITGGGIGGDGDGVAGKPGQVNTGGGGGGSGGGAAGGGAGGSGVIYVRYANNGTITASGGSVTPYVAGPYKVHVFKSGSSSFNVSAAVGSACPSDPRCSVVVNGSLRSSFSVPRPTLDTNGRALTIPNSGYVELLRASTGEVWRTYRQPSVQVAAVPDLCSGAATSTLGWQNAVASATQEAIPSASSAQTITLTDGNLAAGKMFYRKDFTVLEAASYNVAVLTTDSTDVADAYIDGSFIDTSKGSLASTSVNLSVGCHTITVQVTNITLTPQPVRFTAAVQKSGSEPIVATNTSWRVSAGSTVHFSQSDFYADPAIWGKVVSPPNSAAQMASAAWITTQGDAFTQFIAPPGNGCAASCPASSSAYLRDSKDFYVASETDVKVSSLCDDNCAVYIDGDTVIDTSQWSSINQQTVSLTAGWHHIAMRLYNGGAAPGQSSGAVSVVAIDSGQVLARTDRSWVGATIWTPGLNATTQDIISYEDSFRPSPDEIPLPTTLDLLIVGGGGGGGSNAGGGGGGGGVLYYPNRVMSTGTYNVTIGAGGAGGTNTGTTTAARGQNGGNTVFGSLTAIGGGGGASRDNGPVASSGGSGGAGSGTNGVGREAGANGTTNQGFAGGDGTASDQGVASKGGGGGGAGGPGVPGVPASAGDGGAGFMTYMTGGLLGFAGGGGGSNTAGNGTLGLATDGGRGGSSTAAVANRGGGGSGVGGGAGGSGAVIVRIKTGTMVVSTTGSPSVTSVTIQGVAYTVYTFNANGSFTISSIN